MNIKQEEIINILQNIFLPEILINEVKIDTITLTSQMIVLSSEIIDDVILLIQLTEKCCIHIENSQIEVKSREELNQSLTNISNIYRKGGLINCHQKKSRKM